MNTPYTQSNAQNIEQDDDAQRVAQDTAGQIKGPLTGRNIDPEGAKQPKAPRSRKAASAFRTISEVADELDVQQHVLRFWETKFSQVRPLKRGGGRRYYRPEDLELLKKIHHLLYTEGYTIKGVQKLLREKGKAQLLQETNTKPAQNSNEKTVSASVKGSIGGNAGMNAKQKQALQAMLTELKELRRMIKPE